MDDRLEIARGLALPLDEVVLRTSRSSGPGGQHANVTASRVEAVFEIAASRTLTDAQKARLMERFGMRVTAVAQDARSQMRNRELALERLRARIAGALARPRPRRPTRPTRASRTRHVEAKKRQATRKQQRRAPGDGD
jgi:ribosome-associated protein